MTAQGDEERVRERELRERAQRGEGRVLEGSGRRLEPRRLGTMVSVRLEPELVAELRALATAHGLSMSELLRQAGWDLVQAAKAEAYYMKISVGPSTTAKLHSSLGQEVATRSR